MLKHTMMFAVVAGLVLALAAPGTVGAAVFSDNFDTPHNYLTDGLGAYDGLLNGSIAAMDADSVPSK